MPVSDLASQETRYRFRSFNLQESLEYVAGAENPHGFPLSYDWDRADLVRAAENCDKKGLNPEGRRSSGVNPGRIFHLKITRSLSQRSGPPQAFGLHCV